MHIVVHHRFDEIDPEQWNQLLDLDNPFMRHEFLLGLEQTGCVCEQTGWQASHIALYQDKSQQQLLGAMPCYIKSHSYGEYIFDWSWADVHHRNGFDYYPKLLNAVPFTPATGERWLLKNDSNSDQYQQLLFDEITKIIDNNNLSSFHSLFLTESQSESLDQHNYSLRHSNQYHWHNDGFNSFDDYLANLNSKKRKNIKRERRTTQQSEIQFRWIGADQITTEHGKLMHRFYLRTIDRYGAHAYLNSSFFEYLCTFFKTNTLFLFAYYKDIAIAGGLFFKSKDTLYGRYWGALDDFDKLHFETCYYQPIQWCIENGFTNFEAGAQGEHKIARGLMPTTIYSAHWIKHSQIRDAIDDFLTREKQHINNYAKSVRAHSPFRHEIEPDK